MVGTVAWMLQAEGGGAMEAKIDEIGDSTYRLSIYVPEIAPPFGFYLQSVSDSGGRAIALSLRVEKDVPAGFGRRGQNHPGRAAALAYFRSFRGRRMWLDERMACGGATRTDCARLGGLLGIDSRFRRPAAPCAVKRRSYRHSVGSACATSTRRTYRMDGMLAWSSKKPRVRCFAVTCSPNSEMALR
jgi:hypothetical protein